MEVHRLYLDANILIMLGEGSGQVADLLSRLVERNPPAASSFLCTSELSLAELLVHPYRHDHDRLINQYDNWLVPPETLKVLRPEIAVLRSLTREDV